MKKLVLFVFMAVFFAACGQHPKNDMTILNVDGIKINIPLPNNNFTRINESKIDSFAYLHGNPDSLISIFIDTEDYNQIFNKNISNSKDSIVSFDPSSVKIYEDDDDRIEYLENFKKYKNIYEFKKYITITYDIENINEPYTVDKFINEKNNCDDFLTKDSKQTIDKSIAFINESHDENEGLVFQENNPIGFIYDIDNAYGILSFDMYPFLIYKDIYVSVYSTLRLKDKCINTNISIKYTNNKDIIWLKNFSEAWAKAILEANK